MPPCLRPAAPGECGRPANASTQSAHRANHAKDKVASTSSTMVALRSTVQCTTPFEDSSGCYICLPTRKRTLRKRVSKFITGLAYPAGCSVSCDRASPSGRTLSSTCPTTSCRLTHTHSSLFTITPRRNATELVWELPRTLKTSRVGEPLYATRYEQRAARLDRERGK